MSIKFGLTPITKIMFGSTPIRKVMLGSTLVWEAAGGGADFGNASRNFDGNDYIDLGTGSRTILTGLANFTVAFWIKYTAHTSTQQCIIGSYDGSSDNGFGIYIDRGSSIPTNGYAFIFCKTDPNKNCYGYTTSDPSLDDGAWHHIAVIQDTVGTPTATIYIDGTSVGVSYADQDTFAANLANLDRNFFIGAQNNQGTADSFFNGLLADLRIYNDALTSGEIANIIAGTDHTDGLIGHWIKNTDDLTDQAGSNDGTNSGSTFSSDGPLD